MGPGGKTCELEAGCRGKEGFYDKRVWGVGVGRGGGGRGAGEGRRVFLERPCERPGKPWQTDVDVKEK